MPGPARLSTSVGASPAVRRVAFAGLIRYIPDIVRVSNGAIARSWSIAPLLIRTAGAAILLAGLTGCGSHSAHTFAPETTSQGYWYPLSVGLRFDPSVAGAGLDYTDGCLQRKTLPLGEDLKAAFKKEIALVFSKVKELGPNERAAGLDGEVTVSIGFKELELFIGRRATKEYPATLSLGGTVAFFTPEGEQVYTKNLRYDAKGTVETDKDKCEVANLVDLGAEAAVRLAEGFKKNLGTAVKIREIVQAKRGGGPAPAAPSAEPPPAQAAFPPTAVPPVPAPSGAASPLTFHAMFRDWNQNQTLEGGERVHLEIEVKNHGLDPVKGVMVVLDGTPELVRGLGSPLVVGDLHPGQSKLLQATGELPHVTTEQEAELVIALETLGEKVPMPLPKKFVAALRPGRDPTKDPKPVDVDKVPGRGARERRQAVGVAIGIGTSRDPAVPTRQFAAQDAQTMAAYFSGAMGIPAHKVRLITGEQALKQDLVEVLEEWLPQQVAPGGEAFIFFSGRAVVDPASGAVSLLPYEGQPANTSRLYSLRRLRSALARLSARYVVLILDVTLTAAPDAPGLNGVKPDWFPATATVSQGDLLQLVGITGAQTAAEYEEGQHGLFTYWLLRGMGGEADQNKDGVVSVAEAFDYARKEVARTAAEAYGREQEPQAIPVPEAKLKAWNLPLVKLRPPPSQPVDRPSGS